MSDIWDEFWEERLHNQRVHHEAEIREIEAKHERVRSTMLKYVQTAQYALGKNKLDVTAYQLDVLSDLLGVQ
jgi:cephalosporin-C deacetylase-like acetyl esterase